MSVAHETIRDAGAFAALPPDEWDALVLAQRRPSPFMLHAWLAAWLDVYGATGDVRVHVARRDGRLVGALPLIVQRRLGLRVATFLGGTQSALADLLVDPAEPVDTARAIVGRAQESGHDFADLFGIPGDSVLAAAAPAGSLRLVQRVEAPTLDLRAGWDAVYAEKTSSKKRNLHRRRRRQLAEQGSRLDVSVARTRDELAVALEDAFRLHELRWVGRPDGSRFATPAGKRFHRRAIEALAPSGIPRIITLSLDGRAIAFHYYFLLDRCMHVHRLAFDPAFARYSPGLVNTLDAIEAAAEEGAVRVEYLGGDERYKLELSDELAPLNQGLGLARTGRGSVAVAARLAAIAARRRLKRSAFLRKAYFDGLAPVRRRLQARPSTTSR